MMMALIFCIILSQLRIAEMTLTRWPRHQEQPLDNELSLRKSSKPRDRSQLLGEPLNHLQQLLTRQASPGGAANGLVVRRGGDSQFAVLRATRGTRLLYRPICSCETQYGGIIDLGENHYPRFLSESYCKPQTVQRKFHRCKRLNYTVHVLQAREGSELRYLYDNALWKMKLPERLRYDWQLKPIQVGVACIPDTER